MYILVTYDVETTSSEGQKRLRQVAKQCKNYGRRVQNSVFECEVTEAQFTMLIAALTDIIAPESDSIRFYHLSKNQNKRVISIGKQTTYDIDAPLII